MTKHGMMFDETALHLRSSRIFVAEKEILKVELPDYYRQKTYKLLLWSMVLNVNLMLPSYTMKSVLIMCTSVVLSSIPPLLISEHPLTAKCTTQHPYLNMVFLKLSALTKIDSWTVNTSWRTKPMEHINWKQVMVISTKY